MDKNTEKKKALIIEDEPIVARVCSRILTANGIDVDIASNGLIAREYVYQNTYDLYISDIRMPEFNGIQFYRYLEQYYPVAKTRVIFTSGDVMNNDIKSFLNNLTTVFLPKPFTPQELWETAKIILSDG